jgi:carboxyl-terminal processing protease
MLRRFLAPGITSFIVLFVLWYTGFEQVTKPANDDRVNLQKYIQAQRYILDNYVDVVSADFLYKNSLKGFVSNLSDSTLTIDGTPLDTTFTNVNIREIRDAAIQFERAYSFLASADPDEDLTARTEDAIREMFRPLDPHTVYIEPTQSDRIREEFAGKFQGIGVQFDILNDSITVISPISGGPSDQLGIRSGDRIVTIDDTSAVGFTNQDVIDHLRGPKGTTVRVGIKRPSIESILNFNIVRDDIPLYTVDSSYMLDEKTGFIKISRFAATTYDEFMTAMRDLKSLGMEKVVIDLRHNPGGYLEQAVQITSEFFERGTPLVSTKSRHARFTNTYPTRSNGQFRDIPVIVMVDEGSASGSEILAGAIQDNDRGLIVGRRTFGKGLVQQQYELVDNSFVRVTISRYYTPSGRPIQKPYSDGREEYAYELRKRDTDANSDAGNFIKEIPDSLKYATLAGRIVYGGGGIVPDHIIQEDSTSSYIYGFMRRNNTSFDFVREYLDTQNDDFRAEWHENYDGFRSDFSWSDSDMDRFWSIMNERGMVISDTVSAPEYRNDSLFVHPNYFNEHKWIPQGYTKAELARQVWGTPYFYPVFNDEFDTTLDQVMQLWPDVQALKAYLESNRGRSTSLR